MPRALPAGVGGIQVRISGKTGRTPTAEGTGSDAVRSNSALCGRARTAQNQIEIDDLLKCHKGLCALENASVDKERRGRGHSRTLTVQDIHHDELARHTAVKTARKFPGIEADRA